MIALFKILSPQHLLKIASVSDGNALNEKFYRELLHIVGLEEVKEGGKTIIRRKTENRDAASLIEATMEALSIEDVLHRVPNLSEYGESREEKTFNVALELCITWINRVLFLKLLEGQLMAYHKSPLNAVGHKESYQFLNTATINDFDELFKLFHKVLAVDIPDRTEAIGQKYSKVPYLNSSLFEISALEDQTVKVNALDNSGGLPLMKGSILAGDVRGLPTLNYLLQFLAAYDFSSEATEDVREENKPIINASVLGKVFEKINGYKDGSVFTPAFVTMYMCRQAIRLAVVEKFQTHFQANNLGIKVESIEDIYEHIIRQVSIKEANEIVNSLKICDPSVGSGHFLVSALNEIIAIKSELNILIDENGKTLRDYSIEVIDDELSITDENGDVFVYNPKNKESGRVQKTLFHEKQTLIENCLFGVDINPNSVKICRLRLWIELLKNAYYRPLAPRGGILETPPSDGTPRGAGGLETLPNIDINIKCGNSLLSRFGLDADLSRALKSIKYDINAYRGFVNDYKNEKNREAKRGLTKLIDGIKGDFRTNIAKYSDPRILKLQRLSAELFLRSNDDLFNSGSDKKNGVGEGNGIERERIKKIEDEVNVLSKQLDEEKNNVLYKNAFEWRFEFPEVLNNEGDFLGFDLVIGNPPYISALDMARTDALKAYNKIRFPEVSGSYDIYVMFLRLGIDISKKKGLYSWIIPNKLLIADYAKNTLEMLQANGLRQSIDVSQFSVFKGIGVYPIVVSGQKESKSSFEKLYADSEKELSLEKFKPVIEISTEKIIKDFKLQIMSGTTGFEAQKIKEFVNQNRDGIKFTVSGNIDRYVYNNKNVRYMNSTFSDCYVRTDQSIATSKWNFWLRPKIVIAGMTKVIEAVYVEEPLGLGVGCYAIYDFAGLNPKAIVGILNSKYLSYYLNVKFKDKHLAGGYLAINKSTIEALPFTEIAENQQNEIENLVNQILEAKQAGKDSSVFEASIDQLVYQLYDIGTEEQAIIEGR